MLEQHFRRTATTRDADCLLIEMSHLSDDHCAGLGQDELTLRLRRLQSTQEGVVTRQTILLTVVAFGADRNASEFFGSEVECGTRLTSGFIQMVLCD
ncbi:hypothetical protein WM33_14875 [Burkholderia multivorans]|nr:hypothetical protein WM33_14875 [Burkholderia multivorans]KVZ78744.1 hypothetical protein WL23_17645 [Burkholderia multivorans]